MSFGKDLRRIAKDNTERLEELGRLFTLDLFRGVILDTRVDTGRLRGNWQASVGAPASGELQTVDPAGGNTVERAAATIQPFALNYLSNNLPYAAVWEERDGMVGRSIVRVEQAAREAAAKV